MSTMVEIRNELKAKSDRLAQLFGEAGPDLDMTKITSIDGDTAYKAGEIKRLNEELTDLGKQFDAVKVTDEILQKNAERQRWLNTPVGGMVFQNAGDPETREKAGGSKVDTRSFGRRVIESNAIKAYDRSKRQSPSIEIDLPDLFERKTLLTESGYVPQSVRTGLIVPGALRRPVVADLIPQGTTDQIAIVYMEETTTTNAAAGVSEGNAKPESALAFTERSSSVRKIATVLPVTDELINDVPAMESYIEARLRLFLQIKEETDLISGDGNAPNLTGLLNTGSILTQAKGTDPTPDAVYKAMVKIETTSFLPASGVIFNPLDWQEVRLLRTADGIYIWGAPMDAGPERIWGLPVVATTAMTQNTALVGAFDMATQIFRRTGVSFAISDQNEDFFIKNKLMLRVEERLALVVYRPTGLCTVTGV